MPESVDIVIVGGGISGISLAARLSEQASVAVVEMEAQLGAHATGRSAALLVESYGPPVIRRLTGMGRRFFEHPPDDFADAPLSGRRVMMIYAGEGQVEQLRCEFEAAAAHAQVEWLDGEAVMALCPLLRPGVAAAGYVEPDSLDLDTNSLLQGFARAAQKSGACIHKEARVENISRTASGWRVAAGAREIEASILVDAAGPWADPIAALAGAPRRGLQPMRRTAATIEPPPELARLLPTHPFVAPIDDSFYFKPEAAAIMVSLSEETPSDPCDAWADDLDVALALDRFYAATIVPPTRPTASWAGLRTFAPDRNPVVGFEPQAEGFFWYAGQGGFGIQTSPALSALAAKMVLGERLDDAEAEIAADIGPERFDRA